MILLHEAQNKRRGKYNEGSADRNFGLQEGRNVGRKIIEKSKLPNAGGHSEDVIKDGIAGVIDGLNMQVLQLAGKEKLAILNKISMALDDAFIEISKLKG